MAFIGKQYTAFNPKFHTEGVEPSGTINITANGTYDVTQKASAVVEVSGGGSVDYSTTEQNTGNKWIDGKDIYRVTNQCDINGGRFKSNGVDLSGVTEVLMTEGFAISNNLRYMLPFYQSSSNYISPYAVKGSSGNANYGYDKSGSAWNTATIYLTVYYTKD